MIRSLWARLRVVGVILLMAALFSLYVLTSKEMKP